jgi:peptidoglycan/LPS O-acetylase OafA/YrhL
MATTWSLANEEQFYLILPPLVLLLRYRSLVAALIVLVAAAPFCRWLALRYSSGLHAAYVLLPCRWDSLFLGVIGALLMRRPAFVKSVSQRIGLLYTAAAVFAVMVVLNGGRATGTVMLFTWIAMFYLSLILIVMMSPNATLKRMLSARWLTGLGSIAYGVYLLHVPIAAICFHVAGYPELWITDWRCILLILAALALTIAVARTSYRFFESPLIRLGHTVAYARRADTSTEVEVPVP